MVNMTSWFVETIKVQSKLSNNEIPVGPTLPENGAYSGHAFASPFPGVVVVTGGDSVGTEKQSLIIRSQSYFIEIFVIVGPELNYPRHLHSSTGFKIGNDSVVIVAGGEGTRTCEIYNGGMPEAGWFEGMKINIASVDS